MELISLGYNAIVECGVMTVICAVFIYIFYKLYTNTQKITNTLIKSNLDIMNKLLDLQESQRTNIEYENETQKELHNDKLALRMKISNNINQKLIEMLYALHLNRAAIFEFHNTNENLSGFPFAKYSCNFEIVNKGIIPIGNVCSGLQFSMISYVISKFDKNGIYDMRNLEDIEMESPMLHHLLNDNNINHICFIGMYDTKNNLYGFMALEYDDNHKLTEEDYNVIISYNSTFSSILDLKNSNFEIN